MAATDCLGCALRTVSPLPFSVRDAHPLSIASITPHIAFHSGLAIHRKHAKYGGDPFSVGKRTAMKLDDILADFELLDDWEDRYRYVIELGRGLDPLPEHQRTPENKVNGCVSQVWLATQVSGDPEAQRLDFVGDSDAHIVRGLIAILLAVYGGKGAGEILETDAHALFQQMGLSDHLTPQRSNGFASMVERIRSDARDALGTETTVH